jgi:hypothetical protein
MRLRLRATQLISLVLAGIGVALVVKGLLGGGTAPVAIGVLFVLLGLGRLYLSMR